jgi:hypothetical protein
MSPRVSNVIAAPTARGGDSKPYRPAVNQLD